MVAVAPHQALDLTEDLWRVAELAVFRHDDHPQPVAGIEQFGSHRLVREAEGVAAHLLEFLDLIIMHPVRQRHADTREVLVVAGTLDFEGFAVKKKPLVCIPAQAADTHGSILLIDHFLPSAHGDPQRVKRRGVRRPEARGLDRQALRDSRPFAGNEALRLAGSVDGPYRVAVRIDEGRFDLEGSGRAQAAVVDQIHLRGDFGGLEIRARRGENLRAPVGNVDR